MKQTYNYNTAWVKITKLFPQSKNLTILDLGCGDGRIIKHLTDHHKVYGIDNSTEAVNQANQNGIQAIQTDLENRLPFEDQEFDLVLVLDVLEHLKNISGLFFEINRLTKNDSYLIMSLPNHFDLRTRLEILFGGGIIKWSQKHFKENSWNYEHLRFLTLTETKKMLKAFGWHPEIWQFNFMSQGLLPTKLIPKFIRKIIVRFLPTLWSGKFVVRCKKSPTEKPQTIIIPQTPNDF